MKQTLLFILELAFLAGTIVLSFYLLYQSFEEGEQAVNGTVILTGDEAGDPAGNEADETTQNSDPAGNEADETTQDTDDSKEDSLLGMVDTESLDIRVRILDNAYENDTFDVITVCGSDGIYVESGTIASDGAASDDSASGIAIIDAATGAFFVGAGTEYTVAAGDLQEGEILQLTPGVGGTLTVTSLERADGSPEYTGILYLYRLEEGLALVNVLPLEEYLYAVVSSEMPSDFPREAQKAQAVCARTYALLCMKNSAADNYLDEQWSDTRSVAENESEKESKNESESEAGSEPGTGLEIESEAELAHVVENEINEKKIADLDDSVKFQVYNNRKCTESSREAVDATAGVVLSADEVLYYSTSCLSEGRTDLNEEEAFRKFLQEAPEGGAEYGSAWLRWSVAIPVSRILDKLAEEYEIRADILDELVVEERSGSGQAGRLRVVADGETLEIEGEYAIRQFLSPDGEEVVLMDGTAVSNLQLLPSAFFYIDADCESSGKIDAEELHESDSFGETDLGENHELASLGERVSQRSNESDSFDETGSEGYVGTGFSDNLYFEGDVVNIYGGGYGHGNGMSQYGAAQMAADGADYTDILEYYYGKSW
ncbi:MAG: hypothetical protein LUG99_16360 [Lachnospiraceae bacterium]|nr:hypothetical protein [Lachnospiraceae bacterium]